MVSPFAAIENPLVSASQASCDPHYRRALWVAAAFTSTVVCAAFYEWSTSGSATLSGELLVLMETVAIYARAALARRLSPQTDALTLFLTGIFLGLLTVEVILKSLTRFITPEALNSASLLRVFSLAVAIELLSIFALLEQRRAIMSLAEILRPRIFAWIAHSALLITGISSVVAPITQVDGVLGLCVSIMCLLSATDNTKEACSRMYVE